MNRNRFVFLTDLMLAGAFVLLLGTGIALHMAGHAACHGSWHGWAACHTVAGLLFAGLAVIHIKSHRSWYKGLKTAGCKGARKKAVLALSVVFAAAVLSGAALLFVGRGHCHAGLLHYKIGIAAAALAIFHILQRLKILRKGITVHVFAKKHS